MTLPPWRKILYASGSLGVALSHQAFGAYIQFLYIDILGLKASLVGLGWSLYGIWNAVNDPLAGHLSDRTRTRWGRRKRDGPSPRGDVLWTQRPDHPLRVHSSGAGDGVDPPRSSPENLYPAQPAAALLGIRTLMAVLPILASLVVIAALQGYPLHGERYRRMREALARIRDGEPGHAPSG